MAPPMMNNRNFSRMNCPHILISIIYLGLIARYHVWSNYSTTAFANSNIISSDNASNYSECPYEIEITNFQNDDVVTYAIIRITGLIVTEIKDSDCSNNAAPNLVLNYNEETKMIQLKKNQFKALIELKKGGDNELKFSFCCKSIKLIIRYNNEADLSYKVQPLYIICDGHDGHFQAPPEVKNDPESACKRILWGIKLIQCITAEKLHERELSRKTFTITGECIVFRSKLKVSQARSMKQEELWESIGREIMRSHLASPKRKYLGFLSCTRYLGHKYEETMASHQDLLDITESYVALGGGGLALFGSASLYCWPENFDDIVHQFENNEPVNRYEFLDDSSYRGTICACYSTTLGSVLHELYHTFDLGHAEMGMMGKEYNNVYKFFTLTDETYNASDLSYRYSVEFREEFTEYLVETFNSKEPPNPSKKSTHKQHLIPKTDNFKFNFSTQQMGACLAPDKSSKKNMEKTKKIIRKFNDNDDTFLIKSAAVTLAFHKWFNRFDIANFDYAQLTTDFNPRFSQQQRKIMSYCAIRVVEIRSQIEEIVLFHWTFEKPDEPNEFILPKYAINSVGSFTLFVENATGAILKCQYQNVL